MTPPKELTSEQINILLDAFELGASLRTAARQAGVSWRQATRVRDRWIETEPEPAEPKPAPLVCTPPGPAHPIAPRPPEPEQAPLPERLRRRLDAEVAGGRAVDVVRALAAVKAASSLGAGAESDDDGSDFSGLADAELTLYEALTRKAARDPLSREQARALELVSGRMAHDVDDCPLCYQHVDVSAPRAHPLCASQAIALRSGLPLPGAPSDQSVAVDIARAPRAHELGA